MIILHTDFNFEYYPKTVTVEFFKKTVESMSLSKIQDVDTRTKAIIFGYSRRYETQFKMNIPVMIQYIIIGYYWIYDKFTIYGDNMTLFDAPKIGVRKADTWRYNTAMVMIQLILMIHRLININGH